MHIRQPRSSVRKCTLSYLSNEIKLTQYDYSLPVPAVTFISALAVQEDEQLDKSAVFIRVNSHMGPLQTGDFLSEDCMFSSDGLPGVFSQQCYRLYIHASRSSSSIDRAGPAITLYFRLCLPLLPRG